MFERRIAVIGTIIVVLLLLVSGQVIYWQLVRGSELYLTILDPVLAANADDEDLLTGEGLEELPQPLVQRTVNMLQEITRGTIVDRRGSILARDERNQDGSLTRVYSDASLANVIGYTSGIRTGITGLERTYNTELLGVNRLDAQIKQMVHAPVEGSQLELTIDSGLQQAAVQALAGRPGAIVILDGHSGAVLAMASAPTFDPNRVQDQDYVNGLLNCQDAACRAPFVNRATQALYSPGSTWKTVPLMAALETGQVTPETSFDFGEPLRDRNGRIYYVYRVGGGEIPDPNHEERVLSLPMSYAKSANAAFGQIGAEMEAQVMIDYAARLGFSAPAEQAIPVEIPFTPSRLANDVEEIRANDLLRAATAIGQGELQTNPYNMALLLLPVLNDGHLPIPYLVENVREPGGIVHAGRLRGQIRREVIQPETARTVKEIMVTSAQRGYAQPAQVAGLTVGGKTGTAQLGGDQAPHAWFLGWAEKDDRAVIMAIMIENGGEGSVVAAPLFAQLAPRAMEVLETQQ